jgi:hypothetical protein
MKIRARKHKKHDQSSTCGSQQWFNTCLWPLPRTGVAKQSLCLTCNESLFQRAANRLANLGSAKEIQVAAPITVAR